MTAPLLSRLESAYAALDERARTRPRPPSSPPALHSRDVGVVVQGPVVGERGDPVDRRITLRVVRSVRRVLPDAQIVLSTWRGTDVTGLDVDEVVLNDDPGPSRSRETGQHSLTNNVNRQIVSTRAGLERLHGSIALKLRSDLELIHGGFLKLFRAWPARSQDLLLLHERVLVSAVFTANPTRVFDVYGEGGTRRSMRVDSFPYHVSDWFQFGLLEDLLAIWAVPRWDVIFEWLLGTRVVTAEQWIWMSLINSQNGDARFDRPDVIEHSSLFVVNNTVVIEPDDLGIRLLKFTPELRHKVALMTHGEWQRLYARHCLGTRSPSPDVQGLLRSGLSRLWVDGLAPILRRVPVASGTPVEPVPPPPALQHRAPLADLNHTQAVTVAGGPAGTQTSKSEPAP